MARNEQRRRRLLDSALAVLAAHGSRGLTHRAVDRHAQLPEGTCVNYFGTRDELFAAMGSRVFERLIPDNHSLQQSACHPPSIDRMVVLMQELMERVVAQPELQLVLLELRLEATRRPGLATTLTETLRRALRLDLAFHQAAGLPGDEADIIRLHVAMTGLIVHTLTLPSVLAIDDVPGFIDDMVRRLSAEPATP